MTDTGASLSPQDQRERWDSIRSNENRLEAMRFRGDNPGAVKVANWNCKAGTAAGINANTQRTYIREVFNALDCDLIALQELPWMPTNFVVRILERAAPGNADFFRNDYKVIGTENAAIYYDPESVTVNDWTEEINIPEDQNALRKRFTVGHVHICPRNIMSSASIGGQSSTTSYSFLFVSVHMPKNGYTNRQRQNNAHWLLTTLNDYSTRARLPIFIGGDFNTSLDDINLPNFMSTLANNLGIDYVLFSGQFHVVGIEFDISQRTTDNRSFRNFDAGAVNRLLDQNTTLQGLINAYEAAGSHVPTCYRIVFTTRSFREPIENFDAEITYENATDFFRSLGFNKLIIDKLRPHFSELEKFVDYDIFAIIERLEADILADENKADKLAIKTPSDFFEALRLFGFEDGWAQTYTWAIGEAYPDQLVMHSIEECIRLRLTPLKKFDPFPECMANLQNNQWCQYTEAEIENVYVRKYTRNGQLNISNFTDGIDLQTLSNMVQHDQNNTQYWFHATNWENALGIIHNGAQLRGNHTDFARLGAYYLNNDYIDAYQHLINRNHNFRGQHAILIYQFDPEVVAEGRYLFLDSTTSAQVVSWKQVVFSCINVDQNENRQLNRCRAVFGCQCSNPNEVRHRRATHNTPQIRTRNHDGRYAVQLAIRHVRTLSTIQNHLIGVVIYERL